MARIKISAKELLLHGADFDIVSCRFPKDALALETTGATLRSPEFCRLYQASKKWHLQVPEMAISCVEMGMVFHEFLAWGSL